MGAPSVDCLDTTKPLVLLIDDAPDIHRLLSVRLASENLTLEWAASGAEGLARAREAIPALVLLDLNMPGMDGFSVLRALKNDACTVSVPVIVLSASDATDDKVLGLDLGALDYVCKPFNLAELRARVRSALRLHELMQLLSQRAQIDGLTGLWNRQHFDERLSQELNVVQREGRKLAIAMCDLDHFKSVNDTFGHAAGDAALAAFTRVLTKHLRKSDVACRYGGEEFGLVLRDTDAANASVVLERVRAELAQTEFPRHPERRITASFGVADGAPGGSLAPGAWVEAADAALYLAKKLGRNRIQISGRTAAPPVELAKAG